MRGLFTPFFLLALVGAAMAQEAAVPFDLPVPEGWRTETIPFPLAFAPELAYEGLEELRFAPGMFDADREDFWTYAFVWWLPAETELTPEKLAADLETYFRGLGRAVAESNGFDPGDATFSAELSEASSGGEGNRTFRGKAETLDAFTTREQVELHVRVEIVGCVAEERLAVLFELSPQSESHAVWETLKGIREGFRCEEK